MTVADARTLRTIGSRFAPRVTIGAVVLLAACATNRSAPASTSEDAAIRQAGERISREFPVLARARNADAAAAWFAPDAIFYANGMPAVRGRAAIRELYAGFFQAMPIRDVSFVTEEITVRGDVAIETGANTVTIGAPGQDSPVTTSGKYVAVWKRQPDGQWLLWRHSPSANTMSAR
jgi:uncharacterized protein (TIGR02246 family)